LVNPVIQISNFFVEGLIGSASKLPVFVGSSPTKFPLPNSKVYFVILNDWPMNNSNTHHQRIAKMTFATVYPLYLAKVEKKGRTKEELHQVVKWLTGFDDKKLQKLIDEKVTFETFFQKASLNLNVHLITGVICGYRIEEIDNPLTQQVRYLDKLVDELAKGRKMEKILRGS